MVKYVLHVYDEHNLYPQDRPSPPPQQQLWSVMDIQLPMVPQVV